MIVPQYYIMQITALQNIAIGTKNTRFKNIKIPRFPDIEIYSKIVPEQGIPGLQTMSHLP